MSNTRKLIRVVVTWGERKSSDRFFLLMVVTGEQFALLKQNNDYLTYLLWEFNVQWCEKKNKNYQEYVAALVEEGSPTYRVLETLLRQKGATRNSIPSLDMTGTEFFV